VFAKSLPYQDRDFDFAGATAKVADVIHEEQAVYTRSNTRKQPPKPVPGRQASPTASQTAYLPALVPDMSLWGTPEAPAQASEASLHERAPQTTATAPGGKKFMSLEEVEAEILSMSKKPSAPAPQPQSQNVAPAPLNQLPQQFQHQIPKHTPSPGAQLSQFTPPPQLSVDLQGFSSQLPPHLQQMMQNQIPQHAQQLHQERLAQQLGVQPQRLQQRDQQSMGPLPSRNQYGMTTHLPAQQLQSMTETDRMRFLEEESKRLKRNHKIAQLVRLGLRRCWDGMLTFTTGPL
jgi:DNA topoisomerase 2-associated protein PAT1